MSRIFLIDLERRNWAERIRQSRSGAGERPVEVTRRYMMIVEEPAIREIIKKEFNAFPNSIYPHESGYDDIFYCIAGPSCRRPKRLIEALRYKLKKNNFAQEQIQNLEVLMMA